MDGLPEIPRQTGTVSLQYDLFEKSLRSNGQAKLKGRREAKGEGIQLRGRGEPRQRLALLCKNDG